MSYSIQTKNLTQVQQGRAFHPKEEELEPEKKDFQASSQEEQEYRPRRTTRARRMEFMNLPLACDRESSSFFAVSSPGRSPRARGEKSLTRVPRKAIACVKHSGMLCRRDRFTSLSFAFTFNQNKRELHRYGDAKTPQSPVPRYKGIDPLQELAHLKADKMLEFSKRKRTAQFCFV
ncbi:hypothetical protein V6N13_034875 [Hibiscus sabdariffa]